MTMKNQKPSRQTKLVAIMTTIEKKLIQAGVRNLREFGYPDCNENNILTDKIYSAFFRSMLEDNKRHGVDREINAILERMNGNGISTA